MNDPHRDTVDIDAKSIKLIEKNSSVAIGSNTIDDSQEAFSSESKPTSVDERALLRKIDLHLIPWLALLYLLNFLDRSNIGNARVGAVTTLPNSSYAHSDIYQLYNMEADIHITDTQYLIALTTFFFPYSFFEVMSEGWFPLICHLTSSLITFRCPAMCYSEGFAHQGG